MTERLAKPAGAGGICPLNGAARASGTGRGSTTERPGGLREERGAALIIAVAIFVVLLFIALTFYSQARLDLRTATNNQEIIRTDMLSKAGTAIAVAQLRLDKKQHPTYTSLDHGWNTYFDGAYLAGKPWAFRRNNYGIRILDRTWVSWAGGGTTPFKRVPHIDYWADIKRMEAELDAVTTRTLYGEEMNGTPGIQLAEMNHGLGSALAAIKNPLWVPRFQIDPNDDDLPTLASLLDLEYANAFANWSGVATASDFFGANDWPVQYAYEFTLYDPVYNDPRQIWSNRADDYDPFNGAWPARLITPQQKINIWADVDSDGDGLRDAVWIPIAVEVFAGGTDRDGDGRVGAGPIELDNNNDGIVDGYAAIGDDEGGDGIDNDLDGVVDEPDEVALFVYWGGNDGRDNDGDYENPSDGIDNDDDGAIDEAMGADEGIDEADERRVFLTAPLVADSYWGGNDGEDNDGDGETDEADERRVFLTSRDRLDNDGDGDIDFDDPGEVIPLLDDFVVEVIVTTLNEYVGLGTPQFTSNNDNRLRIVDPGNPFSNSVDRLDNDYTQIINDVHGHAFLEPTNTADAAQNAARSYQFINLSRYPVSSAVFPAATVSAPLYASVSGESVSEIAGRVAVRIFDEASKVNLNSAGNVAAVTPAGPSGSGALEYARHGDQLTFAHIESIGPHEFDTRVLPDIGIARAIDTAMLRTGEHKGAALGSGKPQNFPLLTPNDLNDSDDDGTVDDGAESGYAYDAYFGGYGRADDNANALQLQFDGLDNDGDGAYYIHDGVDNDNDGATDESDEARFGIDEPWEGIDEPQELQTFRPLRNRVAELDGVDNDNDGSVDEIGELGDRLYRTGDEMQSALALAANSTGVGELAPLRSIVTVQSSDSNARYQHYMSDAAGELARNIPPDTAPVTGMKLDYNVATADAISQALREDWGYPAAHEVILAEMAYPPTPTNAAATGNPFLVSNSDAASTAGNANVYSAQLRLEAAYLTGLRDESTTRIGAPIGITDARVVTGRILEADAGLRSFQLALNIMDSRDSDRVRNWAFVKQVDEWWPILSPANPRQITYEFAGTESIRINEIMVRAVRRVEAEAGYEAATNPENDPNLFFSGTPVDFDVEVETMSERLGGFTATGNGTTDWEHFPDPDRVGLGPTAGWVTNSFEVLDGGTARTNAIQFRIGPSTQLPPGRYYLTVNTRDENGDWSSDPNDLDFVFKYVRATDRDILDDIATGPADPFGNAEINLSAQTPFPSPATAGFPAGWTFLPSAPSRFDPADPTRTALLSTRLDTSVGAGYGAYAGIPGEPNLHNEAYTVIIPPFATDPADQYYLCIGISKGSDDGEDLAINFLDFSQEPDHEWVELVNVSASSDPIDLSGWLLEIGGGATDVTRTVFEIPSGTRIAPNGSLLLSPAKYDLGSEFFDDPLATAPVMACNGLAAAANPGVGVNSPPVVLSAFVSEPPIPRYAGRGEDGFVGYAAFGTGIFTGQWGGPLGSTGLNAASVFQRGGATPVDFVDRDGDGAADTPPTVEDVVISTTEGAASTPTKAWDRIVPIRALGTNNLNRRPDPLSPGAEDQRLQIVAELVLRGGIFPNYPEEDGVDNDGDNGILIRDGVDNNGSRFLPAAASPDSDGLDNDGDGLTDEGADGIDNDGDNAVMTGDGIDNDFDGTVDEADEGIDEFDESENASENGEGIDEGGIFRRLGIPLPGGFDRDAVQFVHAGEPYWVRGMGSYPAWKEFVERRFFPGDCVMVTLYRGQPEPANIVDRVTYTQRDVENVAPDDVRSAAEPFTALGQSVPLAFTDRFLMFNPSTGSGNERAWPENTMGADFYRSIERKHPLYPGDRFGLANRWTATDGNYDDWGHGTNRYFYNTATNASESMLISMSGGVEGRSFFGHGFSGSPLRANFFARVLEDPRIAALTGNGGRVVDDPEVDDNFRLLARARVRDANFRSQGDLMSVPHMTLTRNFTNQGSVSEPAENRDMLGRQTLQGPRVVPDSFFGGAAAPYAKGASIGMDYPEDLRALMDLAAMDSISLSVGQADFYPLYPAPGHAINVDPSVVEWEEASNDYRAPWSWSPVFLVSLDPNGTEPEAADFAGMQTITVTQSGTPQYPNLFEAPGYPIQLAFLYRNADLNLVPPYGNTQWLLADNVTATSAASVRWPLERRAVMYVSSNRDQFSPTTYSHNALPPANLSPTHPAEALFVWDGADGLVNGEYDAYVITMPDTSNLVESTRRFDPNRQDWLPDKLERARRQLAVDVMFLTDKDGDRKCWRPTQALPTTADLGLNTQNPTTPLERYPLRAGVVPATDGTVHYGVVKVENNYLALFIRNWAASGIDNVNGVTRVVLMSRDSTPGRINVNTAITQAIARENTASTAADFDQFNPLTGLVGFMGEYVAGAQDTGDFIPVPNGVNPWNDLNNVDTTPPYSFAPGNWYARTLQRATQLVLGRGERLVDFDDDGLIDSPLDLDGNGVVDLPPRYDGRYLLSPSELVVGGDEGAFEARPFVLMPGFIPSYYDVGIPTADQKAQAFDELKERYARSANALTAVSDTFEIFVTAQSGTAFDANRDGVVNWRDDNEFRVTGEKRTRTVYER